MNIDKLTEFRAQSVVFAEEGAEIEATLTKLIALLPVYYDHAKAHFANAPFPNGNDRDRMTYCAQKIGFGMGELEAKLIPARDLASSISKAALGAIEIADRMLSGTA